MATMWHGHEVPNLTMNHLVKSVKATGGLGIIGVFVPQDPGASDKLAKKGEIAFDLGTFWFKRAKDGNRPSQRESLQPEIAGLDP